MEAPNTHSQRVFTALCRRQSVTIYDKLWWVKYTRTDANQEVIILKSGRRDTVVTLYDVAQRWGFNPKGELCYIRQRNAAFNPSTDLIPA